MSTSNAFGRLVRELRGSTTQGHLAKTLQCSRSLVANIETGFSRPSDDFLARAVSIFPEHEVALIQAFNALPRRTKRGQVKVSSPDRVARDRFSLLIRVGRAGEARAGMEFALAEGPEPVQRIWLIERLAQLAVQMGDEAEAVARFREAIAASVEESLPGWETRIRRRLGFHFTYRFEFADAHVVFDEGLARNVERPLLWSGKGNVHWYEHEYPAAYAALTTADALGGTLADIDFPRGQVLAEWGHYPAAIADLTHALNRPMSARDHAYARTGRAYAYGRLGDLPLALSEFAAAAEVTPDNGWLYYFRALCYLENGKEDLALEDLERALGSPYRLNPLKRIHAEELVAELRKTRTGLSAARAARHRSGGS